MRRKYPVGIQDFSEIRNGGYVYVDKTKYIEMLFWHGKHYFLSRPRRFGKSLMVSTLEYLFQGRKELFRGLHIHEHWDWGKTNPIIKISFSNIGHKEKGLNQAINDVLEDISTKNGIVLKEAYISGKFKELIETLSKKHDQVVILIDEYDKPIIDYLGVDTALALKNRDILKTFYSILKDADLYIRLLFITGVSKFSRVSIFSDLNNLTDLTIDDRFEGVCGITQSELEINFRQELNTLDSGAIKEWYNGYSWSGEAKVYNPFSLLSFFTKRKFNNFWFETGTPTFLLNLAKELKTYDFEQEEVSPLQLSAFDLEYIQLIPLMFQTGYLTISHYDEENGLYTLNYPNKEVRQSYMEGLLNIYRQHPVESGKVLAVQLRRILENNELDKLRPFLNSLFKSIPYEIWQKENEHFYHAILHLTFRLLGIYVESQVQTSDGRLDALVQMKNFVYAFEFKLDGSAEQALEQLKTKGYLLPFSNLGKTCIGIGVNFSKSDKNVENLLWQEVRSFPALKL